MKTRPPPVGDQQPEGASPNPLIRRVPAAVGHRPGPVVFLTVGSGGSETALTPVPGESNTNARGTKRDEFGEKESPVFVERRIFPCVRCVNEAWFCLKETPPDLPALSPAWPLHI